MSLGGHDSISRYNNFADKYSTGTNRLADPETVMKSIAPARTRDTIETSQEKIDKEVLNRLQANNSDVPQGKLPVVARAGKYIFMAVALPSYMVAYAIPRWIATHLVPQTCIMFGNAFKQCFKPFEEMARFMIQQFSKLQRIYKTMQSKIEKAFNQLMQFAALLKSPLDRMKHLWQQARAAWTKGRQSLLALFQDFKQKVNTQVKKALNKAKNQAKRMLYGRASKDEPLPVWRKKVLSFLETVKRAIQRAAAYPGKLKEKVKEYLSKQYQAYIQPYIELGQTKFTAAVKFIKAKKDLAVYRTKQFISKHVEKVYRASVRIVQLAREQTSRLVNGLYVTLRIPQLINAGSLFIQQVTHRLNAIRNRYQQAAQFIRERTQKTFSKLKDGAKALKNKALIPFQAAKTYIIHSLIYPFVGYIRNAISKPKQTYQSSKAKMRSMLTIKRLKMPLVKDREAKPWFFKREKEKKLRKTLSDKAKRAVYLTKLSISWTRILTGFWMASVRRISEDIIEQFTWEDFINLLKRVFFGIKKRSKKLARKTTKQTEIQTVTSI